MSRHAVLILGLGLLAAGCAAPMPIATPTLLPVQVIVIAKATLTQPPATASPTFKPTATATLVPTRTVPPPSPRPTRRPVVPTLAVVTAITAAPPPSSPSQPAALLPAGVTAQDVAKAEQRTIDLVNAQRAARSLSPLARDETLMGIARARVADMVARNYTGHYDPVTGVSLGKAMMTAAGYTSDFKGENWNGHMGGLEESVDVAMSWFMSDPLHAASILNPNFVSVGVGLAFNGQEWLLVQDFVGKSQ